MWLSWLSPAKVFGVLHFFHITALAQCGPAGFVWPSGDVSKGSLESLCRSRERQHVKPYQARLVAERHSSWLTGKDNRECPGDNPGDLHRCNRGSTSHI